MLLLHHLWMAYYKTEHYMKLCYEMWVLAFYWVIRNNGEKLETQFLYPRSPPTLFPFSPGPFSLLFSLCLSCSLVLLYIMPFVNQWMSSHKVQLFQTLITIFFESDLWNVNTDLTLVGFVQEQLDMNSFLSSIPSSEWDIDILGFQIASETKFATSTGNFHDKSAFKTLHSTGSCTVRTT